MIIEFIYYLEIHAMKIGYARVSTLEQNTDMQKKALKKAGLEKAKELGFARPPW